MDRQDLDPREAPLTTDGQEQAAAAELARARHAARMGQAAGRGARADGGAVAWKLKTAAGGKPASGASARPGDQPAREQTAASSSGVPTQGKGPPQKAAADISRAIAAQIFRPLSSASPAGRRLQTPAGQRSQGQARPGETPPAQAEPPEPGQGIGPPAPADGAAGRTSPATEAAPDPAAGGGRRPRLDYSPAFDREYAKLDEGVVDDIGRERLRQKMKTFGVDQREWERKRRQWDSVQRDARRLMSAQFRPPTSTNLGNPRSSAAAQPADAGQAATGAGQTPDDVAAREAEQERQLRQEQAQALREARAMDLRRGRGRRTMSAAQQRETAERGRRLAGQLHGAAADHNWPYVLVVAVSIFNDVVDIFGLNLLLGLDQVFDFGSLSIMLGARLFIRQQEVGWVAWGVSKVFVWFVEVVPLLGIVPTWTIAALATWHYAVQNRRIRQQREAQMMLMNSGEMPEEEEAATA